MIERKILEWLSNGETGVSSNTIAFKMVGLKYKYGYIGSHPGDPSDFKRCLKLINRIPEIRDRLSEMRDVSPEWSTLVDHWKEVENCFMSEVPGWLTGGNKGNAMLTFNLMQKIYSEAREK